MYLKEILQNQKEKIQRGTSQFKIRKVGFISLIACQVINFNPSLFHNTFIFIVNLIQITAEQFEIRSKAQLDARCRFQCEILSKEFFYFYSGNLFHAITVKYSGSSVLKLFSVLPTPFSFLFKTTKFRAFNFKGVIKLISLGRLCGTRS